MFDDNKVKIVRKLFEEIVCKISSEDNDSKSISIIAEYRKRLNLIHKKDKYNNDRKILSLGILWDLCNNLKSHIKPSDLLDFSMIKKYISEVDLNNIRWENDFEKILETFLEKLDKE